MVRHRINFASACLVLAGIVQAGALAGCSDNAVPVARQSDQAAHGSDCNSERSPPDLGLMTSLPLIWPIGAEFGAIARGEVDPPWQNTVISECFGIVPLDTLSRIAAIDPAAPDIDPLSGLKHLAVIQPRGLSPADNVALDDWVRAGGRLLLVLDPMLTGDYDAPLGDPRRPNDTALVPPVVARWGLAISYDELTQSGRSAHHGGDQGPPGVIAYGQIAKADGLDSRCEIEASKVLAICDVGEGRVALYADAAIFEHRDPDGENAQAIRALMQTAFH